MAKRGGGPQLQNIPHDLRSNFIPDTPDHEFTSADLKQAEAMVVAWDAQDEFLMNAFESGKDIHRIRACITFRGWNSQALPPDSLIESIQKVCPKCLDEDPTRTECVHSERYLNKRLGHMFNYRAGARKAVKILRKEGVYISEADAKRIRDRILSKAVLDWQNDLAQQLRKGWLESPVGRRREFYGLYDEELIRKALNWYAQHTIAHITNRAMCLLHEHFRGAKSSARVVTQTHDSLLITHPKEDRDWIYDSLRSAFHYPLTIRGRTLNIPLDIGSGPNWRDCKK